MGIVNTITKLTEHKIIDNLIMIWKKVKPSKTYWTVAIPTVTFILSQTKSWKIASIIASYANKQIENSIYPLFWQIVNAVATEFYDTTSWELVWLGVGILLIVTYAFSHNSDTKRQEEILKMHNDFTDILKQRNEEIKESYIRERGLIKENFELKTTLILYRSKGWIIEDVDFYITKKEENNE